MFFNLFPMRTYELTVWWPCFSFVWRFLLGDDQIWGWTLRSDWIRMHCFLLVLLLGFLVTQIWGRLYSFDHFVAFLFQMWQYYFSWMNAVHELLKFVCTSFCRINPFVSFMFSCEWVGSLDLAFLCAEHTGVCILYEWIIWSELSTCFNWMDVLWLLHDNDLCVKGCVNF